MAERMRRITLCALACSLILSTGCQCPDRAETIFSWTIWSRVSEISYLGTAELRMSSDELIMLVESSDTSIDFSEVRDAVEGDSLRSGGRVVARFRGDFAETFTLSDDNSNRLLLVRPEPMDEVLHVSGSVYWDTIDCDVTYDFDVTLSEQGARCGDGFVELPEVCDDENYDDDDGCVDCEIPTGQCLGVDPERWNYWACEGEPSECELRTCLRDSDDPNCDLSFQIELETINSGHLFPEQQVGVVQAADVPELACSCEETALSFSCHESCTVSVMPCTTMVGAGSSAVEFAEWAGDCESPETCVASADMGRIYGRFESHQLGIAREAAFSVYPTGVAEIEVNGIATGGELVVAAAAILGEFENESAGAPPADALPQPFVIALSPELEIVWARDLIVTDGLMRVFDVAVDAAGNSYVVGGLIGTLDLEGDTVTVQYVDPDDTRPLELVVLKFSPTGSHQWTRTLGLLTRTDLLAASLATAADGVVSLAAVIDEDYADAEAGLDLLVGSISPEGEVNWLQQLQHDVGPEVDIDIENAVAVARDDDGSTYVAASLTSYGPFQWEVPEPPSPDEARTFVAKFSSIGEHLRSTALTSTDSSRIRMELDPLGQLTVLTMSHLLTVDGGGQPRRVEEITRRTQEGMADEFDLRQYLALHQTSGDVVVTTGRSTSTSGTTENHFIGTLTSRYDPAGNQLWTNRFDTDTSVSRFLPAGVSTLNDQTFVVGWTLAYETAQQGMTFRRIDELD